MPMARGLQCSRHLCAHHIGATARIWCRGVMRMHRIQLHLMYLGGFDRISMPSQCLFLACGGRQLPLSRDGYSVGHHATRPPHRPRWASAAQRHCSSPHGAAIHALGGLCLLAAWCGYPCPRWALSARSRCSRCHPPHGPCRRMRHEPPEQRGHGGQLSL